MIGTFGKITKYKDDGSCHPFVVYMALNKLNGAFYVGATEKGTLGRSFIHLSHARHGGKRQKFYRAIRKYGEDNFKFLTIKECSDYWDALESERQYIAMLKPSYNMTDGGGGVKGFRHSTESRAKMAAAKKGRSAAWTHMSIRDGVKIKLKASAKARKGEKTSGARKLQLQGFAKLANSARRRRVMEVTTGTIYDSVTDAIKAHAITSVCYLCKTGGSSTTGLRFRYITDGE